MSFYSIHDGEDDILWRYSLSIIEWYLYPMGWGLLASGNILICITYRVMSNCVAALNIGVKQDLEQREVDWVNRQYQILLQITNNLSSGFSFSLLCQEFGFLVVISNLFVGTSRMAQEISWILALTFYGVTVDYTYCLSMQFYPMVVLNLNSLKLVRTCKTYLVTDAYSKRVTKTFKQIKVRPMKVHTITLDTLADYIVFVMSFILMLLKS